MTKELHTEYCWFIEDRHPNTSKKSKKTSQEAEVYHTFPEFYLKKAWKVGKEERMFQAQRTKDPRECALGD